MLRFWLLRILDAALLDALIVPRQLCNPMSQNPDDTHLVKPQRTPNSADGCDAKALKTGDMMHPKDLPPSA